LSDTRPAVLDIEKVLHRTGVTREEHYLCAGLYSLLLDGVEKDPHFFAEQRRQAKDRYTARALELLTQLRRDGYFRDPYKWSSLTMEPGLAPLRNRPEFQSWLEKP
jgi:hypothetical protein